jgi:hypothetical protein
VALPWISPSLFEVASITTDSFAHKVRTCRFFIPTEIEGSKVQDEDNQYIIASRDVHFLTDVELVLIPPTTASMMRLPNQHSRILYLRILRWEKRESLLYFPSELLNLHRNSRIVAHDILKTFKKQLEQDLRTTLRAKH